MQLDFAIRGALWCNANALCMNDAALEQVRRIDYFDDIRTIARDSKGGSMSDHSQSAADPKPLTSMDVDMLLDQAETLDIDELEASIEAEQYEVQDLAELLPGLEDTERGSAEAQLTHKQRLIAGYRQVLETKRRA